MAFTVLISSLWDLWSWKECNKPESYWEIIVVLVTKLGVFRGLWSLVFLLLTCVFKVIECQVCNDKKSHLHCSSLKVNQFPGLLDRPHWQYRNFLVYSHKKQGKNWLRHDSDRILGQFWGLLLLDLILRVFQRHSHGCNRHLNRFYLF